MKKLLIYACSVMLLSSTTWAQHFQMPAASPLSRTSQQFSTSTIEIEYSRPSVKGRTIFGDVVPYDKIWRTGANANTKITFGEDINFGGVDVPAGSYSLYTIPGKDSWTIILNKGTENWGLSGLDAKDDVARVEAKVQKQKSHTETFTIGLGDFAGNTAMLNLCWADVKVAVKITADNRERILAYLDQELKGEKPPFTQAANYYLEQNYKLDQALIFTEKAINTNPDAFWLHWLKAKIYAKMGNKAEALKSAELAANKAKSTDYAQEYQNNYEKMKKELN